MSSPPTAPPSPPRARPDADPPAGGGSGRGPVPRLLSFLRNTWRGLTSMRTALVLLFLLAMAALPGALLPQRSLNLPLVDDFYRDHPVIAPVVDALGGFEVFASPWFAAVYLLLMISLVGCVLPRSVEHWRALRAVPVATPRNLSRLPHSASGVVPGETPEQVLERSRRVLRGWRTVERTAANGSRTVSAERGYVRELGNLVFHLSLIGILAGLAAGKMFGYEGDVIVKADGSQFCNTSILGYDSFRAGLSVDGTDLNAFCLRVDRFDGAWLPNGQPSVFRFDGAYQTGQDLADGSTTWRPVDISVNHPLRTDGDRIYMTGYGYAPRFTVTWPDGRTRTGDIQWRPSDKSGTQLSEGATKFERPGVTDPELRRTTQLALTGTFAPTGAVDAQGNLVSLFPGLRAPAVSLDVLRGDLGIDDGRGQSIFSVDQSKIDSGQLRKVAAGMLTPGKSLRLDDGTVIRFDGATPWVNVLIGHDPSQEWVLLFAITMLIGLGLSLTIKRRRFWIRVRADGGTDGGSRVDLGGLARTDRAGYGEEFDRLTRELLEPGTTRMKDG